MIYFNVKASYRCVKILINLSNCLGIDKQSKARRALPHRYGPEISRLILINCIFNEATSEYYGTENQQKVS